ncbi:MAG TPA: hypothetical protein VNX68_10015, partial [Nitrosopumilaceae archaeon]|nr:hypothetical protein [Nitrosopumilaceae archaeon]
NSTVPTNSTVPVTNQTLPNVYPDRVSILSGGYVTLPHIVDKYGNKINATYAPGPHGIFGKIHPACPGFSSGLWQEGNNWKVQASAQTTGASEMWTMPLGNVTGSQNGIFYNPINFFYSTTLTNIWNFFQVDFGLGQGVTRTNFFATYANINNNNFQFQSFSGIPISPGSTYQVFGMLEPVPIANPASYVAEIIYNNHGYFVTVPLLYNPDLTKVGGFSTYNDLYIKSSGSSTASLSDTNASPAIMKNKTNTIVSDSTLVLGMNSFNSTKATGDTTNDVLAPSPFFCYPLLSPWNVFPSCQLSSNANASGNVIINNGVLTIPSQTNLNLDFAHHYLLVNPGNGVLIKPNGKISSDPALRSSPPSNTDIQQCTSW